MGIEQLTHEFTADPGISYPGFEELLDFIREESDPHRWFNTIHLERMVSTGNNQLRCRGKYKRIGTVKISPRESGAPEDLNAEEICMYVSEVFGSKIRNLSKIRVSLISMYSNQHHKTTRSKHIKINEENISPVHDDFLSLIKEQRTYIRDLQSQNHRLMEMKK